MNITYLGIASLQSTIAMKARTKQVTKMVSADANYEAFLGDQLIFCLRIPHQLYQRAICEQKLS